jgi:hypothetical protein
MILFQHAIFIIGLVTVAMNGNCSAAENLPSARPATGITEFSDYRLLDHTISIQNIRAGNQDPSGVNDYYFTSKLVGFVSEPNPEDDKEKRSISLDEKNFGSVKLNALDHWESNPKLNSIIQTDITGDAIRKLTSEVMIKYEVDEKNVIIRLDISLYEKNKKYFFLGEDQLVSKGSYFTVPPQGSFTPVRVDSQLILQDGKSTSVTVNVKYKSPFVAEKKSAPSTTRLPNKK